MLPTTNSTVEIFTTKVTTTTKTPESPYTKQIKSKTRQSRGSTREHSPIQASGLIEKSGPEGLHAAENAHECKHQKRDASCQEVQASQKIFSGKNKSGHEKGACRHGHDSCCHNESFDVLEDGDDQCMQHLSKKNEVLDCCAHDKVEGCCSSRKKKNGPSKKKKGGRRGRQRAKNAPEFVSKYKTELCKNFELKGTCKWGDKVRIGSQLFILRQLCPHNPLKVDLDKFLHFLIFDVFSALLLMVITS